MTDALHVDVRVELRTEFVEPERGLVEDTVQMRSAERAAQSPVAQTDVRPKLAAGTDVRPSLAAPWRP